MAVLPIALIHSLQGTPGFDEAAFKNVHASDEQVTAIRLHPVKGSQMALPEGAQPIPWCSYGYYLPQRPVFTLDPRLHAGAYYVQDASSMFLWHALRQLVPEPEAKTVLDLCAAPGGKSTLLASYFREGLLVSNEVIKQRAAILVENMTKWGSANVVVTNNDPSHFRSLGGFFDVMVVDAPCSGSGLFRKDPDAIAEWSTDAVELCSQRQQRILADALPTLRDGGILLYATCSYSQEEDEQIADWLVSNQQMEPLSVSIPDAWGIVTSHSPQHQCPGYRFYPYQLAGEGFFFAAFRKRDATFQVSTYRRTNTWQQPTRAEMETLQCNLQLHPKDLVFKQQQQFRLFPGQWASHLQELSSHLYIRKAGIALGTIKGSDLIPDHELATAEENIHTFPSHALPHEEALAYLRRQDMRVEAAKGWNLFTYQGLPLGWAKVLPNRINNYYPQEWRIRMQD